jgi:enoyl-CoA hydratase
MTDLLQLRRDEGVLTLLLNNPDGKNALTEAMIERMIDVLEDSLNDQAVRIVVLRGAGKDFCTGFDLDEFYALASGGPSEHQSRAERLARVFRLLHGALKPTVAVVQGRALGVGASLAITCDVVVASTTASFAFPEVTFGFVPAFASALLRRHMSDKQAFELVATGRTIRAEEARLYGLVSRVVPEEGFEAVTGSTLRHLGCCAPETFATIKQLFTDLEGKSFEDALALSTALNARAHSTQAFREAAEQYRSMA